MRKRLKTKKICQNRDCHEFFYPYNINQVFCSRKCYHQRYFKRSAGDHPIAGAIRAYRWALNMTKKDFAKETGLSQSAITRIESGDRIPRKATLDIIGEKTGIDVTPEVEELSD